MKSQVIKLTSIPLLVCSLLAFESLTFGSSKSGTEALQLAAGPSKSGTISGMIKGQDGSVIDFASVVLKPSGLYSMTDANGKYAIENIPSGSVSLSIQFFGMEKIDTTFVLGGGEHKILNFKMKETTFRLNNVTVVATRSDA